MPVPKGVRVGGRQKGTLNKATKDVKALAQKHGADAIKTLATLAKKADSDAAKIAACRELLDRGYGKASQVIAGDPDTPVMFGSIERQVVQARNRDR